MWTPPYEVRIRPQAKFPVCPTLEQKLEQARGWLWFKGIRQVKPVYRTK